MENKRISCKGNAADIPACEYDDVWFCNNPNAKAWCLHLPCMVQDQADARK